MSLASIGGAAWDGVIAAATIEDDDEEPQVSLSGTGGTILESAGAQVVTVLLDAPSGRPVTVAISVDAASTVQLDDFDLSPDQVEFQPGETVATVTLTLIDDAIDEEDETLSLGLIGASNAQIVPVAVDWVVTDDDPAPLVSFAEISSSRLESAQAGAPVAIVLTDGAGQVTASGKPIDIQLLVGGDALQGDDYTGLTPGQLSIPAGSTGLTLDWSPIDDGFYEGDELIVLSLGGPVNAVLGATATHTVALSDDEAFPTTGFAEAGSSLDEGAGPGAISVLITPPSAFPIDLEISAAGDAIPGVDLDIAPLGSLVIPRRRRTCPWRSRPSPIRSSRARRP